MNIILFSDIHANLPALEAFFKSIENNRPDMIFCLGDLVGFNVWPNEVIDMIKSKNITTIAGNHDLKLGNAAADGTEAFQEESEISRSSYLYTNSLLGDEQRRFLRNLPLHIKLELLFGDKIVKLLLVHGSATSIDELLNENTNEDYLFDMMQKADADIMCFGHTHQPYHKTLKRKGTDIIVEKHAINIGSIGKPKDRDPRGCYLILKLNEPEGKVTSVDVRFERFDYDVDMAASAIENSPLPVVCADMLRQAY